MRVDVFDLIGRDAGVVHGQLHARDGTTPPGDGAVMWWASAVEAEPSTSPRIVAPRASASSQASRTRMAAPSAMTKPSFARTGGCPAVRRAVMLPKPATAVGVNGASAPPAMTTSQRRRRPCGRHCRSHGCRCACGHGVLAWALPAVTHRDGGGRRWPSSSEREMGRPDARPWKDGPRSVLRACADAADAGADEGATSGRVGRDLPACSSASAAAASVNWETGRCGELPSDCRSRGWVPVVDLPEAVGRR